MKSFVLAAVAASLIATPALARPVERHGERVAVKTVKVTPQRTVTRQTTTNRTVVRHDRHQAQRSTVQYRKWSKGQRFDARYARDYREIRNPRSHRLYEAPRGYHWVQSGNDAVLVGIASGIIGAVIAGVLN